jgi:type I site-specific restriction-modification system R (restriction) subunit
VRDFIVFEDEGGGRIVKKMAGYHQFHAVQVAIAETLRAAELRRVTEQSAPSPDGPKPGGKPGDRRIGVVWHTQGSGKSLTMAFYARRIIREPAMGNPTVVVLTDRNDLDDQLFGTFSRSVTCCASRRRRPKAGRICAGCCPSRRAASCSPPSTNSFPRRRATGTLFSPIAATS